MLQNPFCSLAISATTPQADFIRAVQEQLIGFINEQIIDPAGEFYLDPTTFKSPVDAVTLKETTSVDPSTSKP